VFVVGVLAVALAMGGLASASPAPFVPILLVDLWLFAYPHVASTLTRVVLDRASRREHWALLLVAPPTILLGTGALGFWGGAIALDTLYFVWQSYHYTRQSYGIARAYRRASGEPAEGRDLATDPVVFAFPVWSLLHRPHEAPASFYRMPLHGALGFVSLPSLGAVFVEREGGELVEIDARPSDAIALAIGNGAPIHVAEKVLVAAGVTKEQLDREPVPAERGNPTLL
jgi:hypothetical protein